MYVKDILTTKIINCDTVRPDGIEDIWVSVQYRKLPSVIISSIYRRPKAPQETIEYIRETLRTVCLRNKAIYMFGDLNDDMLAKSNKLNSYTR